MSDFGQWVRNERTRLRLTQIECAKRAGMKSQQWNRMESKVKQPELHTIESVAMALGLPEQEVRIAAGYLPKATDDDAEQLAARRLGPGLSRCPPGQRERIVEMLERDLQNYVSLLTPAA